MLFLIEYDRQKGKIVTIKSFEDSDRVVAEEARLELELDRNKKAIDNEVVLLEASGEEAVRRTHRRYFEDLTELATSPN
jgi:hypothetical protein